MVAPDSNLPTLTLELGSDRIPIRDFRDTVRALSGLLADISEEACGDAQGVHWEISVSEGSVVLAARMAPATKADTAERVQNTVLHPPQRIRRALRTFPRAIPATRLLVGVERRDILHETQDEPKRHPSELAEYGTVEGTLDTLSVRGGFHFTISEPIWNMAVRCTVPDQLVSSMHAMWRQRVSARGMVHYDREGLPTSIRAEAVELFPYDEIPVGEYRGLLAAD